MSDTTESLQAVLDEPDGIKCECGHEARWHWGGSKCPGWYEGCFHGFVQQQRCGCERGHRTVVDAGMKSALATALARLEAAERRAKTLEEAIDMLPIKGGAQPKTPTKPPKGPPPQAPPGPLTAGCATSSAGMTAVAREEKQDE